MMKTLEYPASHLPQDSLHKAIELSNIILSTPLKALPTKRGLQQRPDMRPKKVTRKKPRKNITRPTLSQPSMAEELEKKDKRKKSPKKTMRKDLIT